MDTRQEAIAAAVRDEESWLTNRHMLFWSEAFTYHPAWEQGLDHSFAPPAFDAVNVHPVPNIVYRGRRYDMGSFMGKQLRLAEIRDFCLAAWHEPKPCVLDEDNSSSLYLDDKAWTIHRQPPMCDTAASARKRFERRQDDGLLPAARDELSALIQDAKQAQRADAPSVVQESTPSAGTLGDR